MSTLCGCGHAKSQHLDGKGQCDYFGNACACKRYHRIKTNPDGKLIYDSVPNKPFDAVLYEDHVTGPVEDFDQMGKGDI